MLRVHSHTDGRGLRRGRLWRAGTLALRDEVHSRAGAGPTVLPSACRSIPLWPPDGGWARTALRWILAGKRWRRRFLETFADSPPRRPVGYGQMADRSAS